MRIRFLGQDGRWRQERQGSVKGGGPAGNMDIFEGTEQIQQLVISRAISGLRVE